MTRGGTPLDTAIDRDLRDRCEVLEVLVVD
jgi:hypothetical protein